MAEEQRLDAEDEQEYAAGETEPVLIVEQPVAQKGQTETGDRAEGRIRRGRAESGNEAVARPLEEAAPHAEHADRAHRQCDDDADDYALGEDEQQHGALTVSTKPAAGRNGNSPRPAGGLVSPHER